MYNSNKKNKSIVFDCGLPLIKLKNSYNLDYKNKVILENINSMIDLKPDMAIISHWHQDHYKGFYIMEKENIDNCFWFFNSIENEKDTNIIRFVTYLRYKSQAAICPEGYKNKKIFSYNGFSLYKGNGYDKNSTSLILYINDKFLMTGDCHYKYFPDKLILNNLEGMIAPHHGANMGKIPKTNSINSKAYISSGYNIYGHPKKNHIDLLKLNNFEVKKTSECKNMEGYKISIK